MPRNTTQTLGATNGGRGGLAGYTELCESIAQFKRDSVRATSMRSVLWVAGFVALCFAVGAVWVLDPRPASLIADYWWLGNSLLFAGGFLVAWRFDRGKLVLWGGFLSV